MSNRQITIVVFVYSFVIFVGTPNLLYPFFSFNLLAMESGWDPQVKKYFRKIMSSVGYVLSWMMAGIAGGIYYGWANPVTNPAWVTVLFYILMLLGLFFLLRYLYRTWKNG